jgi:hypothetical protein
MRQKAPSAALLLVSWSSAWAQLSPCHAGFEIAAKKVDEEISAKVTDFLDRNDPKKTSKPFLAGLIGFGSIR